MNDVIPPSTLDASSDDAWKELSREMSWSFPVGFNNRFHFVLSDRYVTLVTYRSTYVHTYGSRLSVISTPRSYGATDRPLFGPRNILDGAD